MMKLIPLGMLLASLCAVFADDGKESPSPDRMQLLGQWKVKAYERDGQANDEPIGATVTFSETQMTVVMKDGETEKASYTIDPAQDPKHLDMSIPRADRTKTALCIYKLQDDTLTIIFNERGDKRPESFEVGPGDKLEYLVLERVKDAKE